jgi:hypothetical protein
MASKFFFKLSVTTPVTSNITGINMQSLHTQYYYRDKIEKNEMGGACSTFVGEERRIQGFGGGNMRERDHLEEPGIDDMIILRCIFRTSDVGVCTVSSWLRIGTGGRHL